MKRFAWISFPQCSRFTPIAHSSDLPTGYVYEALLIECAMRALDKAMLLGMMRIAEKHSHSKGLTKTDQGDRKVTALRCSYPPGVAVQGDGRRSSPVR